MSTVCIKWTLGGFVTTYPPNCNGYILVKDSVVFLPVLMMIATWTFLMASKGGYAGVDDLIDRHFTGQD